MNKIIMVTGATAGFGRAIAMKFAQNGYNVIITGRRTERLEEVSKELDAIKGIKHLALNFDVRKRYEVEDIIKELPDEWKNIDILVNNAGLAVGMDLIQDGNIDDWDRMVDTNVKGLLYVTRAVAPLMVARNRGHIFNISSIAGKQEYEKGNVYCATKHAVDSLSRSMRIDMLKHNIRVTNIAPGLAETEFSLVRFKGDKQRAKDFYKGVKSLSAEDIAEVVYWCATLPEHVCINDINITPTQQANVGNLWRKE
ncbi:MAG TPA: SDR family NAD(P)-dependent oxidoreductase [Bacteroidales bacterium]|nr:SDR family NAD(P)-dependent oxidoreductase [Bacteroidales bacterium]